MREPNFPPARPGQSPRVSDTNRLYRAVESASDFTAPYSFSSYDGHHISPVPQTRFLIKLTAKEPSSTGYPNRYAWEIVLHDEKGNLITPIDEAPKSEATGFPAVEVFDRDAGTLPIYVEAWQSGGEYLLFDIGCCGQDCQTSVEDFNLRTPSTVLNTDRLLGSDPVNHTVISWLASQMHQDIQAANGFHTNTDGATVTFDLGTSIKHATTAGGNRTYALTGEYPNATFVIRTIQDGTGGRNPTFWSGIRWQYGVQPPLNTLPNAVTDLTFERLSSGNYRHLGTNYWMT